MSRDHLVLSEFPLLVNPIELRFSGKPFIRNYRWEPERGLTSVQTKDDFLDSIVKVDTETGTVARWHAAGLYPGEPLFVPTPSASAEDDGALLSIVLDTAKKRSFLLVLDAATLGEKARAEAPHAIPFHFHGSYVLGAIVKA